MMEPEASRQVSNQTTQKNPKWQKLRNQNHMQYNSINNEAMKQICRRMTQ